MFPRVVSTCRWMWELLSSVISYLFLLLCSDMKSFMKVEQEREPSLSFSLPCSSPSDRGLKSSSSVLQSMCLLCLNLNRPARHPFFSPPLPLFSYSSFPSFSCQSSCHLFSPVFKQWNYFSLFFWVGVSAYALVCRANTLASVFMMCDCTAFEWH